jgi:hypothetical protein
MDYQGIFENGRWPVSPTAESGIIGGQDTILRRDRNLLVQPIGDDGPDLLPSLDGPHIATSA